MNAVAPLVVLAAALVLGGTASAQDAPDPRVEEARTLFESADASFAAGNFDDAAAGFQRSHDLLVEAGRETAPLVWFNVARAYDEGGRAEQALEAYRHFVDEVDSDNADTLARVASARERIAQLEAPPLPPEPEPGPVDRPVSDPRTSETQTAPPEATSGGGGISPIGPILMGAGGAVVVVGAILGGVALSNRGAATDMCNAAMVCPPETRAAADEVATQALVADVLLFGGAAIAVAGLVLTFVLEGDDDSGTAVRGACGPGGCLALVEGSF